MTQVWKRRSLCFPNKKRGERGEGGALLIHEPICGYVPVLSSEDFLSVTVGLFHQKNNGSNTKILLSILSLSYLELFEVAVKESSLSGDRKVNGTSHFQPICDLSVDLLDLYLPDQTVTELCVWSMGVKLCTDTMDVSIHKFTPMLRTFERFDPLPVRLVSGSFFKCLNDKQTETSSRTRVVVEFLNRGSSNSGRGAETNLDAVEGTLAPGGGWWPRGVRVHVQVVGPHVRTFTTWRMKKRMKPVKHKHSDIELYQHTITLQTSI